LIHISDHFICEH